MESFVGASEWQMGDGISRITVDDSRLKAIMSRRRRLERTSQFL